MNKNFKKIFEGILIFTATLTAGFLITVFSFNLFDELTRNQLRILFAADISALFAISSAVCFSVNSKKQRLKRKNEFEKRHNERIKKRNAEMTEINIITAKNQFAA